MLLKACPEAKGSKQPYHRVTYRQAGNLRKLYYFQVSHTEQPAGQWQKYLHTTTKFFYWKIINILLYVFRTE
jgi:hypothetical protein